MRSYGQLTADAVQKLASYPALAGSLSPPAQLTGYGLYEAISGELSQDLTAQVTSKLPAEIADEVTAGAMLVMKFVMTAAATGDVGAAAVELAQTVLNFVPFFGTVVNMMVEGFKMGDNAHLGIGPSSSDKAVRAAFCQAQFAPPDGSGPGKQVMPADIFARSSFNGYGEGPMVSSLGHALRVMGEPDSVLVTNSAGNEIGDMSISSLRARADQLEGMFPAGKNPLAWARVSTLGIPKKTQELLKATRLAIAAMRNELDTDGGAALMLVYVDVLRDAWAKGQMGGYYFNALMDESSFAIDHAVAEHGETCFTHEKRGGKAALDMIQGWKQTLSPYAQFSNPTKLAEAQAELLDRVQGMLDRNNRVELLAQALAHKPRVKLSPYGGHKPRVKFGNLG